MEANDIDYIDDDNPITFKLLILLGTYCTANALESYNYQNAQYLFYRVWM